MAVIQFYTLYRELFALEEIIWMYFAIKSILWHKIVTFTENYHSYWNEFTFKRSNKEQLMLISC